VAQAVFYLLAGPNGAGKSTLFRAAVAEGLIPDEAEFVNADLFEAAHLQHVGNPQLRSEQARQWADGRRAELLKAGQSLVSETVFSHESKLALIEHAQHCWLCRRPAGARAVAWARGRSCGAGGTYSGALSAHPFTPGAGGAAG
jgi:energy-coupling factor transporter ATP-binding protein EcfA2